MHLHAAKPNGSAAPRLETHAFGEQRREEQYMYLEMASTPIAAGFGQRSR